MVTKSRSSRFSRRVFLGLTAGAAAAGLVAACGGPTPTPAPTEAPKPTAAPAAAPTATPAAKTAPSTEQINLTIHGRLTAIDDMNADIAKEYEQKHPNVKVDYQRLPGQEYFQKQLIMAATKTSGDAYFSFHVVLFMQFVLTGVFIDHTPLAKATNWKWDSLLPQAERSVTVKGKVYGLPPGVHGGISGLFINKTMFEKEGMPIPKAEWTDEPHPGWKGWTFDDFRQAAIKLTKQTGGKTTQWGHNISHHTYYFTVQMRSRGGDYLNAEGTKCLYDTPEGREAIGFLANLYNKDKVSPSPADLSGAPDLFASGKIGMRNAAVYNLMAAKQQYKDFEWMVIPGPRAKDGVGGMFEAEIWSVLNTSKHPETTFDLLAALCSPEVGLRRAQQGSSPGPQRAVWDNPQLDVTLPGFGVFSKMMKNVGDLLVPANARAYEFYTTSDKEFDPLFTGEETDPDAAIKRITPKLQAILDKPVPALTDKVL